MKYFLCPASKRMSSLATSAQVRSFGHAAARPLTFVRVSGLMLLLFTLANIGHAATASAGTQQAARLNNVGVAYMNQQLAEKALTKFEGAAQADTSAVIPLVNEGIANVYLHKLPEAEQALAKAIALDPDNVRAWYSLGIAHFSNGNQEAALPEFQHALRLDPANPDTHYFVGTIFVGMKQYPEAIAEFTTALSENPLHASAQFGLTRALQRTGNQEESREHLARFQAITQAKTGTLISSTYGEQGRYAIAQDMIAPPPAAGPMIPLTFEAVGQSSANTPASANTIGGGACVLDVEVNGTMHVVTMTGGEALREYRIDRTGAMEPVSGAQTGLQARGDGVSCAVGDYDNDGLPDLAIALTDRVVLFHNLGHGRFADVTAQVGIHPGNKPAGLTFVDFDHDGDLDLYVTGAMPSGGGSILWRNNGNSTFTEWTSQTGLAGAGATGGAVLSDLNNDRAVDLIVSGASGAPEVFLNPREGIFRRSALYPANGLAPVRSLAVTDWNKAAGWTWPSPTPAPPALRSGAISPAKASSMSRWNCRA